MMSEHCVVSRQSLPRDYAGGRHGRFDVSRALHELFDSRGDGVS